MASAVSVLQLALFTTACDPTYALEIRNDGQTTLTVTYNLLDADGRIIGSNTYQIGPSQKVNTETDEDINGRRGRDLIREDDLVLVSAVDFDDTLVYEERFTLTQLQGIDFQVVIRPVPR
jgi:hypothetical protein